MANYYFYGNAPKLFDQFGSYDAPFSISTQLLYVTATEFGVLNADGSRSYFTGAGFTWDYDNNKFISGTISGIRHLKDGLFVDEIKGVNLQAFFLNSPEAFVNMSEFGMLLGNDILDARYRVGGQVLPALLNGYWGNDTIYGGRGDDQLRGDEGNDTIWGGTGHDFLDGGNGDDVLKAGDGNDRAVGGAGNDVVSGGIGADRLSGGDGIDQLSGQAGNDYLFGGAGSDALNGGGDTDTAIFGFARSNLQIENGPAGLRVINAEGIDVLTSVERLAFDDGIFTFDAATLALTKISSTAGTELINPAGIVRGTIANDTLVGPVDSQPVTMRGYAGDDSITAVSSDSLIFGGAGNDTLSANGGGIQGNSRIYGGSGDDIIQVSGSRSVAFGGTGQDTISVNLGKAFGGSGNDTMTGGADARGWGEDGNDHLIRFGTATGGAGADLFDYYFQVFGLPRPPSVVGWGKAVITDFELGLDKLQFSTQGPAGFQPVMSLSSSEAGYVVTAQVGLNITSTVTLAGLTTPGVTLADLLII